MPIISNFDDLVASVGGKFVLPDGTHSVTIKGAKVETIKTKTGGSSVKLVLTATETAGNTIQVDLFLPKSEQDLLSWEQWQQKSYLKGIQALGIRPEDTDTDVGRQKLIGRTVEILAKQNAVTGYTKYYLRRLLSHGTDTLPSAAERIASQFDATPTEASAGAGEQDANDIVF